MKRRRHRAIGAKPVWSEGNIRDVIAFLTTLNNGYCADQGPLPDAGRQASGMPGVS
jgi:hypothetical protein